MQPSTIELLGSHTAYHVETDETVDRTSQRNRSTTKSAIPPLCRKLINLGHDPDTVVHVRRAKANKEGYVAVLKRDRTLGAWAAEDWVESDTKSPHRKAYAPSFFAHA
ncbi:hypothetical protein [Rhizobium sp. RAF56]|uniref:hypothetical protein n=1 Tax=Rhizobium sp. RAF56 TaxID=3233062 RepID=UPI003F95482A